MRLSIRGVGAALRAHACGRLLLSFVIGASLNLSFAPVGWWLLAILAPAALFALIRGLPPRRAAIAGAAFGVGLFSVGTYWLYTCIHGFGLAPIWLTLFLQAALVAIMASYSALLCFLANRFWLKGGATRDWLVLPALWVLLEWLRGWLLSGFPWLSIGYAFIDSPLAGWAPLFGVYGITWAAACAAVAMYALLAPATSALRRGAALVALGALFITPTLAARVAWTHPIGAFPLAVLADLDHD